MSAGGISDRTDGLGDVVYAHWHGAHWMGGESSRSLSH